MDDQAVDRKGLIREAYRIEGISAAECRSIFLDWALSLAAETSPRNAVSVLLARYGEANPDHPMTAILKQGLIRADAPTRRGGWKNKLRH